MTSNKTNPITRSEISFWLPIGIVLASVVLSYSLLTTKIAVLENKMDNVLSLLEAHDANHTIILSNLNNLNSRVVILETKVN